MWPSETPLLLLTVRKKPSLAISCTLNRGAGLRVWAFPGVYVCSLPARCRPPLLVGTLRITQGDQRCSLGVKHGEKNNSKDQAVHGPEARDERPEEESDGVPAEPALCGKLHPEHYLCHRASRAPGCLSGGGRGRALFHERRDSLDRSNRRCQWGQ